MVILHLCFAAILLANLGHSTSRVVNFLCADSECSVEISRGKLFEHVRSEGTHIGKGADVMICGKSVSSNVSFLRIAFDGNFYFIDASFVSEYKCVNNNWLKRFPFDMSHIKTRLLTPSASARYKIRKRDAERSETLGVSSSASPPTDDVERDLINVNSSDQGSSLMNESIEEMDRESLSISQQYADGHRNVTTESHDTVSEFSNGSPTSSWKTTSDRSEPTAMYEQLPQISDKGVDDSHDLESDAFHSEPPSINQQDPDVTLNDSLPDSPVDKLDDKLPNATPVRLTAVTSSGEKPVNFSDSESTHAPSMQSTRTHKPSSDNEVEQKVVTTEKDIQSNAVSHDQLPSNMLEKMPFDLSPARSQPEGLFPTLSSDEQAKPSRDQPTDQPSMQPFKNQSEVKPQNLESNNLSDHRLLLSSADSPAATPLTTILEPMQLNRGSVIVPNNSDTPSIMQPPRSVPTNTEQDHIALDNSSIATGTQSNQNDPDPTEPDSASPTISSSHLDTQKPYRVQPKLYETDIEKASHPVLTHDSYDTHDDIRPSALGDASYTAATDPNANLKSSSMDRPAPKRPYGDTMPDIHLSNSYLPHIPIANDEECGDAHYSNLHPGFHPLNKSASLLQSCSSLARWSFVCAAPESNITISSLPTVFVVPSTLCRLAAGLTRYFSTACDKLTGLLAPESRTLLNTTLDAHFSSSLRSLLTWILVVAHLFIIWFTYTLLVSRVFKKSSGLTSRSFSSYLMLKEHLSQFAHGLSEQERANSLLATRVVQLTHKLQRKEKEWNIRDSSCSAETTKLELCIRELETRLREVQRMLLEKEKLYDETVDSLNSKLDSVERKAIQLQKEKDELETEWQQKMDSLTANHQKAMEESKTDRDELYGQAVSYYKRMEFLQGEIDRLHDVCQLTEQKLASTESELNSLQSVFTTLKSFDHLMQHMNTPENEKLPSGEERSGSEDESSISNNGAEGSFEADPDTSPDDAVVKLKAYLSRFSNVGRLQAELNATKQLVKSEEAKVTSERELRAQLEVRLTDLEQETNELKSECQDLRGEKSSLQTKLDVLSDYFKERELELQRDLGKHLMEGSESSEALTAARKRNRELEAELKSLRDQLAVARQNLVETEQLGRRQLAELDKRSHENWLAARAADHQLRELRCENASLRQRLMGSPCANSTSPSQLPTSVKLNSMVPCPTVFKVDPTAVIGPGRRSLSGQSIYSASSATRHDRIPPFPLIPPPTAFNVSRGLSPNTAAAPPPPPPPPPFLPDFVPPPLPFPPGFPGLPPPPFTPHFNRGLPLERRSNRSSVEGET